MHARSLQAALFIVGPVVLGSGLAGSPAPPAGDAGGEAAELTSAKATLERLLDAGRELEACDSGRRWVELADAAHATRERVEARLATGKACLAIKRNDVAANLLSVALPLAQQLEDARLAAEAAIGLADAQANLARFEEAETSLELADSLLKDAKDTTLDIRLLNTRAVLASYRGDAVAALPYRQRAADLARETGNSELLVPILLNLGQSHLQLQDHAEALAVLEQVLALELSPSRRAIALASVGIAHFELNQLDDAAEAFQSAGALARKAGNRMVEAWSYGELGIVASRRPDGFEEALAYYDRAIGLSREAHDPRNETVWMLNRGAALRDQGRYEEALEAFRETRARIAGIEGLEIPANLPKSEGQVLAAMNRDGEAEERLQDALALAESGGDQKIAWQARLELARLYRKQGRFEECDRAYREALGVIDSLRGSLRLPLFKADFFTDKLRVYEEYTDFLLESRPPEEGWRASFVVAERARARAFLDSLAESRARLHELLPDAVLVEEQSMLDELSRIQARLRQDGAAPDLGARLERVERRLEAFHVRVRAEYSAFDSARYPEPAPLERVQAMLAPDESLLSYALGERRSHLWIVTRSSISYHRLPERAKIEAAVLKVYTDMISPESRAARLGALGGMLLGPLKSWSEWPRKLIVVPSGALHLLSFEALKVDDRGTILAERAATMYAPSASFLVELRRADTNIVEPRLLALGDARYESAPAKDRGVSVAGNLGVLPHSRREVLAVRANFGARASTVLFGDDATESALKRSDLSRYSILHLAAHAIIDQGSAARSGIVLGPESQGEDGILQVREIYRLPLRAELVTLSACQSALGRLISGEGMIGMARAFFHAGAGAVVATLWNVDDEATAVFMEAFYGHLAAGLGKAEALRQARLEMRAMADYSHPYYWAPYVLIGRGETPVTTPERGLPGIALPAALFAVAVVVFGIWRVRGQHRG